MTWTTYVSQKTWRAYQQGGRWLAPQQYAACQAKERSHQTAGQAWRRYGGSYARSEKSTWSHRKPRNPPTFPKTIPKQKGHPPSASGKTEGTAMAALLAQLEQQRLLLDKMRATMESKGLDAPPPPKILQPTHEQVQAEDRRWTTRASTAHTEIIKWEKEKQEARENLRNARRRAEKAQYHLDHHRAKLHATKQPTRSEEAWQEIVAAFEPPDMHYDSADEADDACSNGAMSTGGGGSTDWWAKRHASTPTDSQGTAHTLPMPMTQAQALHYAALMRMIQDKGQWSTDLQQELEVIATQIQAEMLAQDENADEQKTAAGIAPAEIANGVAPDNF